MTVPTQHSPTQLDKFLQQMSTVRRGRMIFSLDATASRQATWDQAAKLTADMCDVAAATLEVQLVFYRGVDECRHSDWITDARVLARKMSSIMCRSGITQLGRILEHIRKEHSRKAVDVAVFIGDTVEETPGTLYDLAAGLPPLFMFQEGDDPEIKEIFQKLASLTGGCWHPFDQGSAQQLRALLRAAARYATGGKAALATDESAAAVALLQQLK